MSTTDTGFTSEDNREAIRRAFADINALPAIPGYAITRQLKRGGQGVVYEALAQENGAKVAIKVITPHSECDTDTVQRFEREVDFLRRVNNPHICALREHGAMPGFLYIVMNYIDGVGLDEYVTTNGALDVGVSLALITQMCSALTKAHSKAVVHRDLKPRNIIVDPQTKHVTVLDFGLAKPFDTGALDLTDTGVFIGTLRWAAPEQFAPHPDIDVRTDVYGLGLLLYYMLTGHLPYDISNDHERSHIKALICDAAPRPPSQRKPGLSRKIDAVILKCLAKQPQDRYKSVQDLQQDVRNLIDGVPVGATPPTFWDPVLTALRRYRPQVAVITLFIVTLMICIVVTVTFWKQAESARRATDAYLDVLTTALTSANPRAAKGPDYSVRELLDELASSIENRLDQLPEQGADILALIGRTYLSLDLPDQAASFLQRSLERRRAHHEFGDLELTRALVDMGDLLLQWEDYEQANEYFRWAELGCQGEHSAPLADALRGKAQVCMELRQFDEAEVILGNALAVQAGIEHAPSPGAALLKADLATLHSMRGEFCDAETTAVEALDIYKSLYGDTHPHVAMQLLSVASAIRDRGDFQRARVLAQEAYDMQQRFFRDHRGIVQSLIVLSDICMRLGQADQAECHANDAVSQCERLFQGTTTHAAALSALGDLLKNRRDFANAEIVYEQAVAIYEGIVGIHHDNTATIKASLGVVAINKGDYATAQRHLCDAYERFVERFGDEHPRTLTCLKNLGATANGLGNYELAAMRFERVLAAERTVYGNDHPNVGTTLHNLAGLLQVLGRVEEAASYYAEAIEIRDKRLPLGHVQTTSTIIDYARLLLRLGDNDGAEDLFQSLLDMPANSQPDNMRQRARVLSSLGRIRRMQGKLVVAESLLRQTVHVLETISNPPRQEIVDALRELALSLRYQRRYRDAEIACREALSLSQGIFGPQHAETAYCEQDLASLLVDAGERFEDAARGAAEALCILREQTTGQQQHIASTLCTLARAELALGNFAEALSAASESIAIQDGPDWDRGYIATVLAEALSASGQNIVAINWFEWGIALITSDPGAPGLRIEQAIERATRYLERCESSPRIESLRRLLQELCETEASKKARHETTLGSQMTACAAAAPIRRTSDARRWIHPPSRVGCAPH